MTKDERRTRRLPAKILWLCPWLVCLLTGCATASSWDWLPWKKSDTASTPAAGPKDSFVMRGEGIERDRGVDSPLYSDLEGAKRLFQSKDYGKAESAFHKLANNKKAPVGILDEIGRASCRERV